MNNTERFNKIMDICNANGLGSFRDRRFFDKLTDDELCDNEKVMETINEIKSYNEYAEIDKKYPNYIYESVRQNLGKGQYDISVDDRINRMDSDEVFKRVCVWNNLINYDITIKDWIKDIYGVAV